MAETGKSRGAVRWYELAYAFVLVALILFAVVSLKPDRVGIVDFDRALNDLGLTELVAGERQAIQDRTADQLEMLREQYGEQRRILAERLAAETDEAARTTLAGQVRAIELAMKNEAEALLSRSRNDEVALLAGYRARLQPMINAVARAERLDVIFAQGPQTVYVHGSVDVTKALVEHAQSRLDELKASGAPADAAPSP